MCCAGLECGVDDWRCSTRKSLTAKTRQKRKRKEGAGWVAAKNVPRRLYDMVECQKERGVVVGSPWGDEFLNGAKKLTL